MSQLIDALGFTLGFLTIHCGLSPGSYGQIINLIEMGITSDEGQVVLGGNDNICVGYL